MRVFQSAPFSGHRIDRLTMKFYPPRPSQIRRLAAGVFLTRNILPPASYSRRLDTGRCAVSIHLCGVTPFPTKNRLPQLRLKPFGEDSPERRFMPVFRLLYRGESRSIPQCGGAAEYHSSGNWNQYPAKLPLRILSGFSHIKGDGSYSGDRLSPF